MTAPFNAPRDRQAPTMDGFVTDYISMLTASSDGSRPMTSTPRS